MGISTASAYLLLHGVALGLAQEHARSISIILIALAAMWAGFTCLQRAKERAGIALNWLAMAIAMFIWASGMLAQLLPAPSNQVLTSLDYSMILFVLYMAPLALALAIPGHEPRRVRCVDATLMLILGALFIASTLDHTLLSATSEDDSLFALRRLLDVGNLFIFAFALIRLHASIAPEQRSLYRTLSIYAGSYLLVATYINHVEPAGSDYGGHADLLIATPFLLLAVFSRQTSIRPPRRPPSPLRSRIIQAASPLILPLGLLLISIELTANHPVLAVIGFTTALLGYGLRNVLEKLNSLDRLEKLDSLARVDALTGIANRRQFDEVLTREWDRARRVDGGISLLMIDVDHFKSINDVYGHQVGDDYLRTVANVLTTAATRGSDFVARWGGEEFVVLIPGKSQQDGEHIAQRIRTLIAASALPSPSEHGQLTVSIGIALAEAVHNHVPCHLVASADNALYQAKRSGRDRIMTNTLTEAVPSGSAPPEQAPNARVPTRRPGRYQPLRPVRPG